MRFRSLWRRAAATCTAMLPTACTDDDSEGDHPVYLSGSPFISAPHAWSNICAPDFSFSVGVAPGYYGPGYDNGGYCDPGYGHTTTDAFIIALPAVQVITMATAITAVIIVTLIGTTRYAGFFLARSVALNLSRETFRTQLLPPEEGSLSLSQKTARCLQRTQRSRVRNPHCHRFSLDEVKRKFSRKVSIPTAQLGRNEVDRHETVF